MITEHEHRLDALADELSSHGYYTFAAIPDAVPTLWSVTVFDLVIITSDVADDSRDRLAQLAPPIAAKLLTLADVDEVSVGDRIRARLGR